MAEHKKILDQRKKGAPGSKQAEVFHLQEAMEQRNERNVRSAEGGNGGQKIIGVKNASESRSYFSATESSKKCFGTNSI